MAKDAEYYRNYRARKKAERLAAMTYNEPLFAPSGSDAQPQPNVAKKKVVQPSQPEKREQPQPVNQVVQPQPLPETDIATIANIVAQRIENKMGNIIDFPGLKEFREWESEMERQEKEEELRNQQMEKEAQLQNATEVVRLQAQVQQLQKEQKELNELKDSANATPTTPTTKFSFPEISFKTAIQCFFLLLFIAGNTAFLVMEQHFLYKTFGYNTPIAVAIAILTEGAVVLLSYFACTVESKKWKIGLYAGLVFAVVVLHGLVTTGAKDKGSEQISNQEEVVRLKKRLATFESLEDQSLARISNIDKDKYPTLIASLTAKLNKPGPEGYSHKISELRSELRNVGQTSGAQLISDKTDILVRQREMALMLNLVFAHLLGFLLGRKRE